MANIPLTSLPLTNSLIGTEVLLGVQGGTSVQIPASQLAALGTSQGGVLLKTNNLSDVQSASASLTNIGGIGFVQIGAANGVAGLDGSGHIPISQLTTIANNTILGNISGLTNPPTALTSAQASALIGAPSLSGNNTFSGSITATNFIANESISSFLTQGSYAYGALTYSDNNILASFENLVNSYNEVVIQNASNGATASANLIISNNLGTATTFFGEFGMNSSGFTGSGSLMLPSAVYLDSTSADLVVGTTTANSMHIVINSGTADTVTFPSSGNFFQADFSNATVNSRLAFQSYTVNGNTTISAVPNGTSTTASLVAANNAVLTNASTIAITATGANEVQLVSGINGSGTYLPLSFYTNNLGRFTINTSGSFGIGPVASAVYGSSGQAFVSAGNAAAPAWGGIGMAGVGNDVLARTMAMISVRC